MVKKAVVWLLVASLLLIPLVIAHETNESHEEPGDETSVAEQVIQEKLQRGMSISVAIGIILALVILLLAVKLALRLVKVIMYLAVIAVLILVGYSFYYFNLTSSESTGITVCEGNECFWAAHIHAELQVLVCGEELYLPLESGDLSATHIHKERNQLHFHERLPVDPETKEVTDFSPLRLGVFFEKTTIPFTPDCIGDHCNGDLCNGIPGTLTMTVDGQPNTEFQDYIWKEGDTIIIKFE